MSISRRQALRFMAMSILTLTSDDLDFLESLPDSELESWMRNLPLEQQTALLRQMASRTTGIPMVPTVRQADFLGLTCREALYGGAAGSGKSDALLAWLAEGASVPTYSGIIFRRTYKQLHKSNDSLVAKSRRLYPALGGMLNQSNLQWRFPSGAMIEMGALEHENSVLDYQGNSYHRIAFDELTQFSQDQYEYLVNSRIRKAPGFPIALGARSGANPGGPGHAWVKSRFVTDEAMECLRRLAPLEPCPAGLIFEAPRGRKFVPARIADNPHLDVEDYTASLSEFTNPITRGRLLNGDWSLLPDGLIKTDWLRYYAMKGEMLELHDADGRAFVHCDQRECSRFATLDTAGTSEDATRESKGRSSSWSVLGVWDKLPGRYGLHLTLRHVERKRVGYTDLRAMVQAVHKQWQPSKIKVEDKHFGPALVDDMRGELPIETVSTGVKDKVTRAKDLLNMLEAGQVYLPRYDNGWRPILESEWLSWQGLDDETNDQIDMAAYAAMHCKQSTSSWGGVIK